MIIPNPINWIATLQPWWYIPIALALLGLGLSVPLNAVMRTSGYVIKRRAYWTMLFGPIGEEVIFRFILLIFLAELIGFLPAVAVSAVLYMIYMSFVYGPPFAADGLVLGVLFSLAFVEFGLPVVIAAHIIYNTVFVLW